MAASVPTVDVPRRWPWAVVVGYLGLVTVGQVLEYRGAGRLSAGEAGTAQRVALSAALLVVAACGALIVSRRRDTQAGPLLLALAAAWAGSSVLDGTAAYGLQRGWPVAPTAAWLAAPAALVVAFLVARLLLGFPDGWVGRTTRAVAGVQVIALALGSAAVLLAPGQLSGAFDISNPHGLGGAVGAGLRGLAVVCFATLFLSGVASVVVLQRRRRAATGERRQQLTAVSLPLTTLFAGLVLLVLGPSSGTDAVAVVGILLSFIALAVAMAVALLRYRLYALDIVLERSVVLLVLVGVASLAYVAAVLLAGLVVGSTRASYGLSVAATTVTALALLAAQRQAVLLARRVVYGRRATPYDVLSAFGRQVSTVLSLDRVLPAIAGAAVSGTGAHAVRVEVSLANGTSRAATWPTNVVLRQVDAAIGVEHESDVIGYVLVELERGDRLDPTRERLLVDLARQAALALRNVQLAADLEESVKELRASRQRLVTAQDAERRQVERDLHDGLQHRLVQVGLTLQRAGSAVPTGTPELGGLLAQAAEELGAARTELRELARGIHPAVLTEAGLAAAVEWLAERAAVPVAVKMPTQRWEPALESTAYFVVAEALTNIAKHAQASSAQVVAQLDGDHLLLRVCDDGRGGADPQRGTGLQGLQDRVSAVNGTLRVTSPPSGGTELIVAIPCAPS